ncbi:hypothetical protein, partial [Aeromonas hydrophila]|uniref:hypothetical protein n=1 Tax=Aeromonas hydrophila TaxID=644 RepID=UPI001CC7B9F1
LREDMRQSSKWAKAELMRRKGRLNDQSHGSGLTPAVALVVKAPLTPHQLGFGPFAGLAHILPQSVNFCGG